MLKVILSNEECWDSSNLTNYHTCLLGSLPYLECWNIDIMASMKLGMRTQTSGYATSVWPAPERRGNKQQQTSTTTTTTINNGALISVYHL